MSTIRTQDETLVCGMFQVTSNAFDCNLVRMLGIGTEFGALMDGVSYVRARVLSKEI